MDKENLYRVFTKKNKIIEAGIISDDNKTIIAFSNMEIKDDNNKVRKTLVEEGTIDNKILNTKNSITNEYTTKLKEYIRTDLAGLTDEQKNHIIEELLNLSSTQITELKSFPETVKLLNGVIGSGAARTFLNDMNAGNTPYDTHTEVDNKITAAISALNGMLTTDANGNLVFSDDDKDKQILITDKNNQKITVTNENALVPLHQLDKKLSEKVGIGESLIDLTDELRYKQADDGTDYIHYFNEESQKYVNSYVTDLSSNSNTSGFISTSHEGFSIIQRLLSNGNEFSGIFKKDGDWVEYLFNDKIIANNGDTDLSDGTHYPVKFIATADGASYKFKRIGNDNIEISAVNADIYIDGVKQSQAVVKSVNTLFGGVDPTKSLAKFRAYIVGGVREESQPNGESYGVILTLKLKVHAEYAFTRMVHVEKTDFDNLESTKQEKLTNEQLTKINNIPTGGFNPDEFLKKTEYDLKTNNTNQKVFKDAKELLLEDSSGTPLPQTSENAAASIKIVNDKISAITGGTLDNKIQDKFTQNSDSLTMNEVGEIAKQAKLGDGFKGDSYYSHNSTGKITVGGNDNLAPGQTPGNIVIGEGSGSIEIGKASEVIKVGELALDTQINFANGTDALPVPSNVIKKDQNDNKSKIFKQDGTAGITLEKLATIDTYVDDEVKKATVASDWEVVSDVPVLQFTTSPGDGGNTNTTAAGIPWLTDKYTDLSKFENDGKNYEVVKFNLNKDGSNNPEGILFLVKVGAEVKQFKTWEEVVVFLEANNWEAVKKINDFTFNASSTSGAIAYSEHFGDLDDNTQRTNFMENVKIGYWYTFNIGGNPYQAVIVSGDKTSNFVWVGKRVIDGANGKTTEFVRGSTSVTGHAEVAGSFTGDAFSSSVALPGAYAGTQYIPKLTIEQMLLDSRSSNDFDEAYTLMANQVERNLSSDGKVADWRHGETIKSTTVAAGHPIQEGMTINFFDDYNNWIPILYNDAKVQHAILKYPERTIKADLAVEKITDWNNAWTGAGTSTGTDKGWKITFSGPKLASDDSATTFPHSSNPLEMKLISIASGGTTATPIDFPKDFLTNPDDLLGEQSENKEMWMQYNVADVLGNTWLSYSKGTSQDINLPSNKTIYDIEGVFGYSNNKLQWYNDYTGDYLPSRLSNLTLNNFDIFGADTKIIIELHRADDQTTGTFTEYLNLELRPVIENGVINVNKVNIKHAGIFTGGPGSNLKALVDTVTDGNKEIAQAAHIHYINIRFRGGK